MIISSAVRNSDLFRADTELGGSDAAAEDDGGALVRLVLEIIGDGIRKDEILIFEF